MRGRAPANGNRQTDGQTDARDQTVFVLIISTQ